MRRHERGAALVLVVIGMLALLAMAGLAIDTAHVLLNKSRLQSALDAAALAAAKSLSGSTNTTLADTKANLVFTANLAQYPELSRAVSGGLTLTTQYSSTLIPFNPGTAPATFRPIAVAPPRIRPRTRGDRGTPVLRVDSQRGNSWPNFRWARFRT